MKILMAGIIALSGLFGIDLGQTAQTVPTPEQQQLREYVKEENIDLYKLKEEELQKILKDFKIELPTATINSITPTDTTMTVNYDLLDPSSILMHTAEYNPQIRAYENGTLAASEAAPVGTGQSLTLTGLTANTEYTVIVSGPYDLLGIGEPYNEAPYTLAEQIAKTEAGIPEAIIHLTTDTVPTVENYSSLDIVYDLIDDKDTLINEGTVRPKILLYKGAELVNLDDATVGIDQTQTFASLEPNTTYTVQITGQYDVDGDGTPDNTAPYILDSKEFTTSTETRPIPEWDQVYGSDSYDGFWDVEQTTDGGYIAVGETRISASEEIEEKAGNVDSDGLIVKFDANGNYEWENTYGGIMRDYFANVEQTSDGGYIALGTSYKEEDPWITDGIVVKFDEGGNIEWDQVYTQEATEKGEAREFLYDIDQTEEGGYIVSGFVNYCIDEFRCPYGKQNVKEKIVEKVYEGHEYYGLLLKLDSEGNIEWEKEYGAGTEIMYNVEQTSDGGYIVSGDTTSSVSGEITDTNNGLVDGLIVKFDSQGNIEWDQVYGGSQDEEFTWVIQTNDGGYVAVGYTESSVSGEITDTNNGGWDALIVKFDSQGNPEWNQVYGGVENDFLTGAIQVEDGGYVVVGYTRSGASGEITDVNNGGLDGLLVKFDAQGNHVWDQVYGGEGDEMFYDVEQTNDGGYIVSGDTTSSVSGEITDTNNGGTDGLLVKFQ